MLYRGVEYPIMDDGNETAPAKMELRELEAAETPTPIRTRIRRHSQRPRDFNGDCTSDIPRRNYSSELVYTWLPICAIFAIPENVTGVMKDCRSY